MESPARVSESRLREKFDLTKMNPYPLGLTVMIDDADEVMVVTKSLAEVMLFIENVFFFFFCRTRPRVVLGVR